MTDDFGKDFWESHWQFGREQLGRDGEALRPVAPNPYLERELAGLVTGTALDAGCGEGAEASWLAGQGWQVTAADISAEALRRAARAGVDPARVDWVEADLSIWQPAARFNLVTTFYAHAAMPQLAFYARIADWVAPGGTLLIVAHSDAYGPGHNHGITPPVEATVTAATVTAIFGPTLWHIVTAEERDRTLDDRSGQPIALHDVIVRATRSTVD